MIETVEQATMPDNTTRLTVANYLKGGIGNQLFQHVFATSLARKLNAELLSDVSFFNADPYNNQSVLKYFDPNAQLTQVGQLRGPGNYMLRDGVLSSISDQLNLPADAKVLALDGYWQSEKLLDRSVVSETYSAIARSMQSITESAVAQEMIADDNAVAVHIRRRDYGHMGVCEPSYYIGALDFIRKRYPDSRLYVFSDEPNFAQQFLGPRYAGLKLVNSGGDLSDLYLMSLCKHFVIANSTYSWWAAYFAESKGGIIISPKEWVTIPGVPSPCPERWIQIPNAVRSLQVDQAEASRVEGQIHQILHDQAVRNWLQDKGGSTLRITFDHLKEDDVVLDVGSYQGDWAAAITSRYPVKLFAFEPVHGRAAAIAARFIGKPQVKVLQHGLATFNGRQSRADKEPLDVRSINEWLSEEGIQEIALMKLNMAGAEYDLLDQLIESGLMQRVRKLQVQFDDRHVDAIQRREVLTKKLCATHRRNWHYYFVWEEWERI
ncbi:MAG TPA: alpha-1,2-fucosyltransferase [Aquabacterium sp.]|nr:alpha-1,2-fucosyltransferase [Aquabacterium sp.]